MTRTRVEIEIERILNDWLEARSYGEPECVPSTRTIASQIADLISGSSR